MYITKKHSHHSVQAFVSITNFFKRVRKFKFTIGMQIITKMNIYKFFVLNITRCGYSETI